MIVKIEIYLFAKENYFANLLFGIFSLENEIFQMKAKNSFILQSEDAQVVDNKHSADQVEINYDLSFESSRRHLRFFSISRCTIGIKSCVYD